MGENRFVVPAVVAVAALALASWIYVRASSQHRSEVLDEARDAVSGDAASSRQRGDLGRNDIDGEPGSGGRNSRAGAGGSREGHAMPGAAAAGGDSGLRPGGSAAP